jgi:polyphosphate kinase 2
MLKRETEPVEQSFGETDDEDTSLIGRKEFESEKYDIQVELMKLQEWVMKNKKRVAIVFEGRDAAGKGSTIKRFTEYLQPKGFKVVALGVPTPREKKDWFGRYEKHLPSEGEIVFFDRSWYNRSVVEPAMGYCSEEQYMEFMENILPWEEQLMDDGLILIKLWFSITKEKQLLRFEMRQKSRLKYWKFSPNDAKVVDKWDIITKYKNQMFNNASSPKSPWIIINSNDKRIGMLNAMRYVLWEIDYDDKDESVSKWYPEVVNVIK